MARRCVLRRLRERNRRPGSPVRSGMRLAPTGASNQEESVMKRLLSLALPIVCTLGVTAIVTPAIATAQTTKPDHSMVSAADLKWVDLPSLPPGAQAAILEGPMDKASPFTARLRFPANYRIPPHWHPAIEHVTVLSGTLYR